MRAHPTWPVARCGHCLLPVLLLWQGTIASAQQAQFSGGASFGSTLSVDGTVLAVGAPWEDEQRGAVYVYRHSESAGWREDARLVSSDGLSGDMFGAAVAVSGSSLLVGSPGGGREGGHDAGAAYVFHYTSDWQQIARLTDPNPSLGSRFGEAVAVHGIFAFIGAPLDDDAGTEAGTAHVFLQSTSMAWTHSQEIRADRALEGDRFGSSISLDAEHAVVGAPGADEARGRDAGLAFVFQRSAGSNWHLQAVLTAGDAGADRHFGTSVAVSRHLLDTRIMVGAPDAGGGTVYYYSWIDEFWQETYRHGKADSRLGASVALHDRTALAGAPAAAQVLVLSEQEPTYLHEAGMLDSPASRPGSCFGCAVDASEKYFAIGEPAVDYASNLPGTVYLFNRQDFQTGIAESQETAGALVAIYPNPFRTATTIALQAVPPVRLRLEILDGTGRSVAVPFDGFWQPGQRHVVWHAHGLASGIYYAAAYLDGRRLLRPMLLLR